ncbi:uncharacterized protein LAJ45_10738 [Morchella importuna]|uniref:uncharacterized protein n=1 Tax=Morchella importuna TaxID=1174673 RepID=UPI001E8E43AC|nr:uncharacterized protein LAJ45_10738 [Morchella importuna]KAH8145301.1 hypothetical protein LAJ45_10738 [Morchella importuna]
MFICGVSYLRQGKPMGYTFLYQSNQMSNVRCSNFIHRIASPPSLMPKEVSRGSGTTLKTQLVDIRNINVRTGLRVLGATLLYKSQRVLMNDVCQTN